VKSNESEVFNRVVNRTLYSKKIVMAVMLATIMVGSAFVVTMRSLATDSNDNPTVEGWNLEPWVDWTTGNVKRYLEGEVVPIRVTIPNPDASDGVCDRTIEIALDYFYESPGKPKRYGFETAVPYKWGVGNPSAPFDAGSGDAFSVPDVAQGTVRSVTGPALIPDGQETKQVWTITVTFADGSPQIYLKTGGLLALSTGTIHGASWYPGASLHFALENEGTRTVSVFVDGALAPPSLTVEKSCTPDHVAENDFMTIQLIIENLGQADAKNVMVVDKLPMILWDEDPTDGVPASWVDLVQYVDGSTWYKTSENPTPTRWVDPVVDGQVIDPDDGTHYRVLSWDGYPLADDTHRGTGVGGSLRIFVVTIWFQVSVVNPGERNVMYTNYAEVSYDDGHEGDYDPACDNAPFWVIQPAIEITKRAFMRYDQTETSIHCAAAPYDSGYENEPGLGDWITFEITVSNPSLDWDVDQFWVTDAAIAAQQPDYNGDDVIWYAGADIPHATLGGDGHLVKNSFTAYFNYQITGSSEEEVPWPSQGSDPVWVNHANVLAKDVGEKHFAESGADWAIDILHPDASITKTADREIVANHQGITETITYTFSVQNLGDTDLWFAICDPMFAVDPPYSDDCESSFAGNLDDVDPLPPWYDAEGQKITTDPPEWTITRDLVYHDPAQEVDPIDNTVELCAWDQQLHKLKRTDSETVDVVHPEFTVSKRPVDPDDHLLTKDWVGSDMMVLYEITVTNTGDTPLYFRYTDDKSPLTPEPSTDPPPPLPYNFVPPYTNDLWNGLLGSGLSDTKYWWYEIQVEDIETTGVHKGEVKNTVTVTAWWNDAHRDNHLPTQDASCWVEVAVTIGGTVFHDVGAGSHAYDGLMESDEIGLQGFWVDLWYAKQDSGGNWIKDTSPGKGLYKYMASKGSPELGEYFFDEVMPGDYIIEVLTIPPFPGSPDSPDGYFPTRTTTYVVHPEGGDAIADKDFALAEYSTILGWKWLDKDQDTIWDGDEEALNGWTVTLTGYDYLGLEEDPQVMITPRVITTADIEDPRHPGEIPAVMLHGAFVFDNLKPGKYKVTETLKDDWAAIKPVIIPPGENDWFDVTPGHIYDQCHNFANVPLIDVEGTKFYDKNMDGVWDNGEPPLAYFKMVLWKATDPRKANLQPADYSIRVDSDITDATGSYEFLDVRPGKYMVKEEFPTSGPDKFPYGAKKDWFITNPEDQTFDLFTTIWTPPVDSFLGPELGNMRYVYIWGYHFQDYYGIWGDPDDPAHPLPDTPYPSAWPNGVFNKVAGDPPLGGMGINLYKWGGSLGWVWIPPEGVPDPDPAEDWTTTSEWPSGVYSLKVVPGTYKIVGELGELWIWTTSSEDVFSAPLYYNSPEPVKFRADFGHAAACRDPELKFVLEPGWNLWSVPMTIPGGLTASKLLEAIGPAGAAVSKLDKASGEYLMYVVGDDPVLYDFPIDLGEGCYIWAMEKTRFGLIGDLVYSSQTDLVAGWNIVGFSQLGSMMASELLTNVDGCTAWAVSCLDATTGEYLMYVLGDAAEYDFEVGAGLAYFVWADGPGHLMV
jgi:hypothetical protein